MSENTLICLILYQHYVQCNFFWGYFGYKVLLSSLCSIFGSFFSQIVRSHRAADSNKRKIHSPLSLSRPSDIVRRRNRESERATDFVNGCDLGKKTVVFLGR